MISSPIKKGAPFLPSASTVRRLPSVVETPYDNENKGDERDRGRTEKKNSQVPISDSCMKRKLTREEETLSYNQSCDNVNQICDTTRITTNNNIETENPPQHNPNDANHKLRNIIKNLEENELFEDPDFPAVPKSLFYR